MKPILAAAIAGLALMGLLAGCGDSSKPELPARGELRLLLVDQPATYDAVFLIVNEVAVHLADADSTSGWKVLNDSTRTFDLLGLTNGISAVLGDAALDPGHYTQIRLKLGAGSSVVVDGVEYPLSVPSGLQSGLKLNHAFTIEAGALYQLTLDFDASRSIVLTGNHTYRLSPVLRLVATQISGTIAGTIDPAAAKALVWTLAGTDTVSTAADTTSGVFRLMALPAGSYDVHVAPRNLLYRDSTIVAVPVVAQQETSLGTIALGLR